MFIVSRHFSKFPRRRGWLAIGCLAAALAGASHCLAVQAALQVRLLHWYVNTSGIPPMDKDDRDTPPYYPTPAFARNERDLLDH